MAELDLNLLPALDALLHSKNVTVAARQIGVSQPTMSGILGRLRDQLHDPLLVRVGKSMQLTQRADALLPEVRQMLLAAEKLTLDPGPFRPESLERRFTMMTSEFGLFLIFPQVLEKMMAVAKGVQFDISAIDQPVESVYSGRVDLCVTGDLIDDIGGEAARSVRTKTLMTDRFVAIVDNGHPLTGLIGLDEFLAYPHVATQFLGSSRAVEDVGSRNLSSKHPPRVRVPSFLSIAPMVAGTNSIGIVPARLAPQLCCDSNVRPIMLSDEFAEIAIKMLWHIRDDHDAAHTWLRGMMVARCQELVRDAVIQTRVRQPTRDIRSA